MPIYIDFRLLRSGWCWSKDKEIEMAIFYNQATGEFATTDGTVTVPAATYTQNPDGSIVTTPGVTVLTVTGTV